ncbi:MAG TPA: sugar phosphate isomerase/epimerase family protein [Acidobacteriaceae bacterium]|nr:sugar phosphate isomerase/epimerase family protein [Acidobacteriaceae bacterium]
MRRRDFLGAALGAAVVNSPAFGRAFTGTFSEPIDASSYTTAKQKGVAPMAIGVMIAPSYNNPEVAIARVKELGMSNCFLDLDGYIGKFNSSAADRLSAALQKHDVIATSAEIVGPGRLVWNFWDGPETIGLVPPVTRSARIEALKQTSDFAKRLGIPRLQTHCGFLPENPRDPLYQPTVEAIREIAIHCAGNRQDFLMETGQETPTTVSRAILDANQPNLGVGLDTANLILYGKANPVDAVDIIGPHIRSVHAKDGRWPADPMKLGKEVLIGTGLVDFLQVFSKLQKLGYQGAVTIERETSGPQQMEDVKHEKLYLERVLSNVRSNPA